MLMEQTMRWYGPRDPVNLSDIRQAGCSGVVTALHHIPVGDVWTTGEISARKRMIEQEGLTWTVIESLPVHEDIKKQRNGYHRLVESYQQSLRNLAACGLKVVTYNFMPVLDWMRTDIAYTLPNGSKALKFVRSAFVAFDLFLLRRTDAEKDYSAAEIADAERYFSAMDEEEKQTLYHNALLGLPGSDEHFTADQVLSALKEYEGIGASMLQQHLFEFLKEVVPVAEALGLKMAIHPDDPPYPILGLPRIVSTEEHVAAILESVPSPANGLCFCTGSYGARPDNNLVHMIKRFGDRIHFLHLRNTRREPNGDFFEADHLGGDTDMFAVVKEILLLMKRRNIPLPMRPDHGHQMLDDLSKTTYPGYSAIGRLKGLAELRGLEAGIARFLMDE